MGAELNFNHELHEPDEFWYWTDLETGKLEPVGNFFWCPGQPDNIQFHEDCIALVVRSKWNYACLSDVRCFEVQPKFVCEYSVW